MSRIGTLLPRANAAACPQLAEPDVRPPRRESGFEPGSDNALFFTFQWLGSFAGARDEELRQWAERAVLQGDDGSWIGISGDIDWQRFERQVLAELQHREREHREEATCRQEMIVQG